MEVSLRSQCVALWMSPSLARPSSPVRVDVEPIVVRQWQHVVSIGIHCVDFIVPVAIREEYNASPVRRPMGTSPETRQFTHVPPVGVHHVDPPVAVAVGGECNAIPVWGPRSTKGCIRAVREFDHVPPVGIHDIDFIVPVAGGCECNVLP